MEMPYLAESLGDQGIAGADSDVFCRSFATVGGFPYANGATVRKFRDYISAPLTKMSAPVRVEKWWPHFK